MKNPNANGFSLVEVIIATVVLAMAASTGYVAAEIRNATWNTQRSAAREQIVEQLRSSVFDNVVTTTTPVAVGRYRMTWTVVSVNNFLKRVSVIAQGPAYRMGGGPMSVVTDTMVINVARP